MKHTDALLEPPQKAIPRAQRLMLDVGKVAPVEQRIERLERLRGAHGEIRPVAHLEPLGRELHVEEPSAAALEVIAAGPFARELAFHTHPDVVHLLRGWCPSFV